MEINVWHEKGRVDVTVMAVEGDIAFESADELVQRVEQERDLGAGDVLIDLEKAPYMSSSGLRALNRIFDLLEKQDEAMHEGLRAGTWKSAHLKLMNPSKDVLAVLKMAGYDYFLEIHHDLKEAVASF